MYAVDTHGSCVPLTNLYVCMLHGSCVLLSKCVMVLHVVSTRSMRHGVACGMVLHAAWCCMRHGVACGMVLRVVSTRSISIYPT
jgi:hypothetical protein